MQNRPIILIGMHRSGTSMLTRLLEELGLFVGFTKEENHESVLHLKLNEWIFHQANASWDNPYNIQFINDDLLSHIVTILRHRMKAADKSIYLGPQYRQLSDIAQLDRPWGWKDPRNTYTITAWQRLYPDCRIIHIYRNPVDVCNSLSYRERLYDQVIKEHIANRKPDYLAGNIKLQRSPRVHRITECFDLWKCYVREAFSIKHHIPVKHIRYEDLLSDPLTTMIDVCHFAHIEVSDSIVSDTIAGINQDRRYAFLENGELVRFYEKIRNDPVVSRLGYDELSQ